MYNAAHAFLLKPHLTNRATV